MTGQSGKTGPPEEMGPPLPVYKAGREEQVVIQGPQAEELTALFGGKIYKLITMKGIHCLAGILLVLGFVQVSWQVPLLGIEDSSSFEVDNKLASEPWELSNMKRHSEGTFSNDYSKYLEDRKAQDFVRWLMSNKRSSADKRHADGTFTSDVSSYLKEQAIKDFVANLKSGQIQRESQMDRLAKTFSRRHVDGSFTSDVNKVLDSIAAKEYLLWVMTSKPSGESNKRQDD